MLRPLIGDSPPQPRRHASTSPPPILSRGDSGIGSAYQMPSALLSSGGPSDAKDMTTKSLIHRLRSAVSMQEVTLRSLREPLAGGGGGAFTTTVRSLGGGGGGGGGGFSTNASSHGVASSAATPSHFHVASRRRWCAEFADTVTNAMSKMTSLDERWAAAQSCLDAFSSEAIGIGRSFLERYLGDDANDDLAPSERSFRTQSPSTTEEEEGDHHNTNNAVLSRMQKELPAAGRPNGGGAQEYPCEWATATQLSNGSFLTITLLDCEDNASLTAASKEQQCHMLTLAMQMVLLPAVLIFPAPRCVIQWRGRVLLVAASPICSGEPRRVADHAELAVVMGYLSDALHLARYFCPKSAEDTTEEVFVAGHPTATTRLGRDGRWYLDALTNLFPHFPPARGAVISLRRHMLHLRAEAVIARGTKHALSPAAFLMYGTKDSSAHNTNVRECCQTICQKVVQEVAAEITTTFGPSDETQWDAPTLISMLHVRGVNVGCLGLILTHVRGAATWFVFSEMFARTARDYLRNGMSRRVEVDDGVQLISAFLSEISRPETFMAVWQDELFQRMTTKFAAYGSFFAEHATHPPYKWLNRTYVMRRLPALVGFQFAAGVSVDGTSPFHFPIKSLLLSKRSFPLPPLHSAVMAHAVEHISVHHSATPNCQPWLPGYICASTELRQLCHSIVSSNAAEHVSDGPGGVAQQLERLVAVSDAMLTSIMRHLQQTLPMSVVPAATPEYGVALLSAATAQRRVAAELLSRGGADEQASRMSKSALRHAEGALKVLQRRHSRYFSSSTDACDEAPAVGGQATPSSAAPPLSTNPSPLVLLASTELARCLEVAGYAPDALQLMDKSFQQAAAATNVLVGRRGLNSTAASTPRAVTTGRSATSSVEVQALSLPSGSIHPPAVWLNSGAAPAACQPAVARSTSAGAQRTKMSVSIIGEEVHGELDLQKGAGSRGVAPGEGLLLDPSSCAASTMPDSEAGRALSRSGHDAMSLSDFENDAITANHNFFISRGHPTSGSGGFNTTASSIAAELADMYEKHGHLSEAETAHRYAYHATVAMLGDDHPSVSICLNNLAVNVMSQEKYVEAEDLFRQDLALSERIFGPDHPNVSSTLNNLACLLDKLERPAESEPLLLRDLEITRKAFGEHHPSVATACNNLAATYLRRNMLEEALSMFGRALDVRRTVFGEKSSPVAEVLFNLGAVLRRLTKPAEALVHWEKCLDVMRSLPSPPGNNTTMLRVLEAMCIVCEELGDYERSEALMEHAFRLKQEESSMTAERRSSPPRRRSSQETTTS